MALLQILPITHPKLQQVAEPVEFLIGDETHAYLRKLSQDMMETTQAANGAGLAAVQVGEMVRMFVMKLALQGFADETFINPEIIEVSDEMMTRKEGCLSMPELFFEVDRHKWVKVRFTDLNNVTKIYEAHGYASICVQHEIDHLNGVRHIDHLSSLRRDMMLKKFKKHVMTA